jgi:hypothetical protein
MFRRDGDSYRAVAFYNASPEIIDFVKRHHIKPGRHTITARVVLERRAIHVADLQADPEYKYVRRDIDPIRTRPMACRKLGWRRFGAHFRSHAPMNRSRRARSELVAFVMWQTC